MSLAPLVNNANNCGISINVIEGPVVSLSFEWPEYWKRMKDSHGDNRCTKKIVDRYNKYNARNRKTCRTYRIIPKLV